MLRIRFDEPLFQGRRFRDALFDANLSVSNVPIGSARASNLTYLIVDVVRAKTIVAEKVRAFLGLDGGDESDLLMESCLRRIELKYAKDSPLALGLKNLVYLVNESRDEYHFGVGVPKLSLIVEEVDAIIILASHFSSLEVLCDLSVFGGGELRKRANDKIFDFPPLEIMSASLKAGESLGGAKFDSPKEAKASIKGLGVLLSRVSKLLEPSAMKLDELIETCAKIGESGQRDASDKILEAFFTTTQIRRLSEYTTKGSAESVLKLLDWSSSQKVTLKSSRGILLAISALNVDSDEVRRCWGKLPIEDIVLLSEVAVVKSFLRSEFFRSDLLEILKGAITTKKPLEGLSLLGRFGQLPLTSFDDVLKARLGSTTAEEKLVRHYVRLIAESEIAEGAARESEKTAKLVGEALSARDQAVRELEVLESEVADLRDRLTKLRESKASLREFEVHQAQSDAIRIVIDLAERLSNWVGDDPMPTDALHEIVEIVQDRIESLGARKVGSRGQEMVSEHEFFDFDGPRPISNFVVVVPAYTDSLDGSVVIRRGIGKAP